MLLIKSARGVIVVDHLQFNTLNIMLLKPTGGDCQQLFADAVTAVRIADIDIADVANGCAAKMWRYCANAPGEKTDNTIIKLRDKDTGITIQHRCQWF